MSKERYNEIIDEVYHRGYLSHVVTGVQAGLDKIKGYMDKCLIEFDGFYEYFTNNPSFAYGFRPLTKEELINKCKTDKEFSEKWGLKIEERELSLEERLELAAKTYELFDPFDFGIPGKVDHDEVDKLYPVAKRIITLQYNEEKVEVYD